MTKTTLRKRLEAFFHSKTGKILPVLLIALLIGAASSTVYTYYIMSSTATVRTPDVRLVAGTDASESCPTYPCATVSVSSTYDYATVGFSLFPSVSNSPQPATYYSNLTTIQNKGTAAHTIKSIQISGLSGGTNLGTITVYYCSTQTEFNPNGTPVTACVGSYSIISTSTGTYTISGLPVSLPAGSPSKGYIEVAAFASSSAVAGSAITFQISIQWV